MRFFVFQVATAVSFAALAAYTLATRQDVNANQYGSVVLIVYVLQLAFFFFGDAWDHGRKKCHVIDGLILATAAIPASFLFFCFLHVDAFAILKLGAGAAFPFVLIMCFHAFMYFVCCKILDAFFLGNADNNVVVPSSNPDDWREKRGVVSKKSDEGSGQ